MVHSFLRAYYELSVLPPIKIPPLTFITIFIFITLSQNNSVIKIKTYGENLFCHFFYYEKNNFRLFQ